MSQIVRKILSPVMILVLLKRIPLLHPTGMLFHLEFLKEKEAYTGTDAYIERAAREKFGWVKDGEIIFRKQEDGQGADASAPSEPDSSAPAEE